MPVKVRIRKAIKKDIPAIVELWKELMELHKELDPIFTMRQNGHIAFIEFVRSHIVSKDSCVLVAEARGNVIGYCIATLSKHPPVLEIQEYGVIDNFAITKDWRRKGIGERLFKNVRVWFRKKGISRIEVRYSTYNSMAANFWVKMGFTPYLKTVCMEI